MPPTLNPLRVLKSVPEVCYLGSNYRIYCSNLHNSVAKKEEMIILVLAVLVLDSLLYFLLLVLELNYIRLFVK